MRTEPSYLEGLKRWVRNPAVRVKIVGSGKSPLALVEQVIKTTSSHNDDFDEMWCVFDVDDFSVSEAEQRARRENVRLAISNPCFELWLLLHHQKVQRAVTNARQAITMLRRHVPEYDKVRLDFADFVQGIEAAIDRARVLHEDTARCGPNPSSTMWRLAEKIMERR